MKNLPNITEILTNIFLTLIDQIIAFVPKLVVAIVILVIGNIVAKILAAIIKKILVTVGVDKIGEKLNEIDVIKQMNIEVKFSAIIPGVLKFFVLLIFITSATETLGIKALSDMVLKLANFVPQALSAAIMLLIGIFISDIFKNATVTVCKSFNVPSAKLIGNVVFFFFFAIILIASLGQAGINTTLLESTFNLLIGGIILAFAIGYGFASKDILANILTSFYSKGKYKPGQIIQVDDIRGEVVDIDATSLTLKTSDGRVYLPLQILQSKKVEVID